MRFAVITACVVFMCIGCQSTPNRCPEIVPYGVLETEPAYAGEISIESDDAAIRYVAIAEQLFDSIWGSPYYLDLYEHGIDNFVAHNNETDEISSEEYKQWLNDNEHWLIHIEEAASLRKYRAYVPAKIYGERNDDELFLRAYRSTRSITSMLEDDSVRLWAQGDTIAAIERIDLMIRVSLQTLHYPAATSFTGLSTSTTVELALMMYERMLQSPQCGDVERAMIRDSVRLTMGDDPTQLLRLAAREFASLHHAMEGWFEVEGGSYELWILLGKYIGEMAAIQPLLDAFDTAIEVAFEGKEIEEGADPFKWPPDVDAGTMTTQALSEMMGLEYEYLKLTFDSLTGDFGLILREFRSKRPDLSLLYSIRERHEVDSPISSLLYLDTAYTIAKNHARLIETRDRVIALCEAE